MAKARPTRAKKQTPPTPQKFYGQMKSAAGANRANTKADLRSTFAKGQQNRQQTKAELTDVFANGAARRKADAKSTQTALNHDPSAPRPQSRPTPDQFYNQMRSASGKDGRVENAGVDAPDHRSATARQSSN